MDGNPATFYNVPMAEMPDFGDPKYVDVWADDVVTLSLQYSTQWDSLAHVGAQFDADGDGVEEAVYYNGYRAGTRSEEHTSELQSLMRISYAVFCLKKKTNHTT